MELLNALESGEITWESSGLLDGLSDIQKREIEPIFNSALRILANETDDDIKQILVPCIRRVYSELSKIEGIPNLAIVFTDAEKIHSDLVSKYKILKNGIDILECYDSQAESVFMICENYCRSIRAMVRKDRDGVIKMTNRDINLSNILK